LNSNQFSIPWSKLQRVFPRREEGEPRYPAQLAAWLCGKFEQDNDIDALLNTLRLVAQAQGDLTALARKTSVSRQALHEALSAQGSPRLRTFQNVLGSLGLRMTFKPVGENTLLHR